MRTQWFSIASPRDEGQIQAAAEILRRGGLLAIPTETVYGLGANGLDEAAVAKIFRAKGRPQDNPLILHIPSAAWLERCCVEVPEAAYRLAEAFWPGPLTLILKKRPEVPLRTTGGLDTVGVRCPDHAVTRAIIQAAGVPVAAPSANLSGRPSCTTAAHVREDMDGRIEGAVDGGDCAVGVESTILDLTVTPPRLLRPGGLPLERLGEILGEIEVDGAVTRQMAPEERPRAPGMKYRHYAPRAPLTVVTGSAAESGRWLCANAPAEAGLVVFDECVPLFPGRVLRSMGPAADREAQARRVFDALRFFDGTDVPAIYAQCPDGAGLGLAVGNRLKKAAGFQTVDAASPRRFIGITGCTGAGKTSLLGALARLGGEDVCLLDCDAVYHHMLGRDQGLRADLEGAFGPVFDGKGALDREKLGAVVFRDPDALARLDAVVRAHVPREALRRADASGRALVALDAIKLLESGLGALCDVTVAVTAAEERRVERVMARDGITREAALARVRAQRGAEYFRAACDMEFVNDYPTPREAEAAALAFWEGLLGKWGIGPRERGVS